MRPRSSTSIPDYLFISRQIHGRGTAIMFGCYVRARFAPKEMGMIRTISAMAVAGLLMAAVSGASQAAPIAPLPAAVTSDSSGLTQVRWHWHHGWHHGWHRGWHHGWRRCWWRHGYRHCW
jgi:hypothetical protein